MTNDEIRKILSSYRPGDELSDPIVADAKKAAESDPELARWFADEQAFDRGFAEGIGRSSVPAELKTRLLENAPNPISRRSAWPRRIALAAAAIIVLGVFFSSWRGLFQPNVSLADYRSEMVSFIKLPPPLELESGDRDRIQNWLGKRKAPIAAATPPGLRPLEPVGCRVLSFRGRKVTLICFRRGPGKLLHLFVVERAVLPKLPAANAPVFGQEGEWLTAAWEDSDHVYLLGVQGDRALLEHYLHGS